MPAHIKNSTMRQAELLEGNGDYDDRMVVLISRYASITTGEALCWRCTSSMGTDGRTWKFAMRLDCGLEM